MFAAAATLYLLTAQRGPAWQDSGIFQWRIHAFRLGTYEELGIALAHPLLIVLGKAATLVPVGPEVWRVNVLCGLAAAVAAANLAVLVRRMAPRTPSAAWLAGGAFALAHTVWWLATITESHALLVALLSGELLALVALLDRPRVPTVALLGLLNGLGASTHNLALLALPAYGLTVLVLVARRRLRWQAVALFVACWCAGASLLLGLIVTEAGRSGPLPAVSSALFGTRWRGDVTGLSLRPVALGAGYILYNFPNLILPLGAVGLWRLRSRAGAARAAVLGYLVLAHLLFAVRYPVPDQFMFFVPLYFLVALLGGLGLDALTEGRRAWLKAVAMVSLAVGPALYAAAPAVVSRLGLPLPGTRHVLPGRDHARYWLSPWKHDEDSAGRFARRALDQLRAGAAPTLLVADSTTYWPLKWVARVERDVTAVHLIGGEESEWLHWARRDPDRFWQEVRRRGWTVWTVSNTSDGCPRGLLKQVEDRPTGVLYRVPPAEPTTQPDSPAGRAVPPLSAVPP